MRRDSIIDRMAGHRFDVAIIGGGINGAVCAAVLAGRGADVVLVERGDFAGVTSQETSNLIWGGIKYLQTYEIPLVWSLCGSRNKLMRSFPSRIREVPFLAAIGRTTPFSPGLAALGAAAYWLLGRGRTAPPRVYSARGAKALEPLLSTDGLRGAVRYNEARLVDNDARFVWDFVRTAIQRGALAANYVEMREAELAGAGWRLHLADTLTGAPLHVDADVVVNAAGPSAVDLSGALGVRTSSRLALSKGVHLVVPRLLSEDRTLAFFDDHGRLFFVIPMYDRSVIGTTDTRVGAVTTTVDDVDRAFILDQVNRRLDLAQPLSARDVIAERCGVRPLVVPRAGEAGDEDWMALSRRHEVHVDQHRRVVTILGGKLTDCINVGDEVAQAVHRLGVGLGPRYRWYGEDGPRHRRSLFELAQELPVWSRPEQMAHLTDAVWRRQGAKAFTVLDRWRREPASAEVLFEGTDITRGEFAFMVDTEMVVTLDDLLRRRTPISQIRSTAQLADHPGTLELAAQVHGDGAAAAVARLFPPPAGQHGLSGGGQMA